MKRKFLGIVMFAAIAVAAGWNVCQNESKITLSDLGLANVEALARGEDPRDCIIENCRWNSGSYCDYDCNGVSYTASNMYNK